MNLSTYILRQLEKIKDKKLTINEQLTINELLELSVAQTTVTQKGKEEKLRTRKRIYSYLSKRADKNNKVYGANQLSISRDLNISRSSVSRHLIDMNNCGLIEYTDTQKRNESKLIVLPRGVI